MIDRVCSSSLNSHTLWAVCLGGWFAGEVEEGTALGTLMERGREGGELNVESFYIKSVADVYIFSPGKCLLSRKGK